MLALPVERLVGSNHHHHSSSASRSRLSLSPDSSASDTSESIDVESQTSGPDHGQGHGHSQSQGHPTSSRSNPGPNRGAVCHEEAYEEAPGQDSGRVSDPSDRPPIVTCDKANFPACTDPDDNHFNDKSEANPRTPSVNSSKSLNTQLKNHSKSLSHSPVISNRSGDQCEPPSAKFMGDNAPNESPHRCDTTPRLAKNGISNPEPYYRSNLNCSCKSITRSPATTSSSGNGNGHGRRKGPSTKTNVPSPPRLLSDSPEKSSDNEVKVDGNNRNNKVDIGREINRSPPNLLPTSFSVGNGNSCHGINLGTQTEQQHVIRVKSEMPSPSPQEVDMDERLAKDGYLLLSSSSSSSQSHKLTREEEEELNPNAPGDNGPSDKVNNGERISNANANTNCCKNEANDCPSSCSIQRVNSNSIIKVNGNRIRGSSDKRKTSSSWTSASPQGDHRAETSSLSLSLVQLEGDRTAVDNNDQSKDHDDNMDGDDDNNNERRRQEETNNSFGNSSNHPRNNHKHSHYQNGDNLATVATGPPSRPLSTASSTCSSYCNGKSTNGSSSQGSSHLKFSIDDILRPDFGLNPNSNSIDIHSNNNNNIYNNKGGRYAGQLFNPFFSDTRGNFGQGHHPSTKFYPQHLGSSSSTSILCKELPSPSSSISSAATNYNSNHHHHGSSNISKARSGSISSTEGFRPCRPSSVKSIGSEDSNCSSGRRMGEEVVDDTKVNPPVPKGPLLWPAWVYCTRYSDRPSSGPRSRRIRKKTPEIPEEKRPRTAFTGEQLSRLKQEFDENRYLTEKRRQDLARDLNLHENQIKIWFQNKRAKLKKSTGTKNGLALQLMAQGLYNHSTVPIDEDDEMEMMM